MSTLSAHDLSLDPETRRARIRATIAYFRRCQEARASGYLTTDPAWLLDMAISRRAGWVEAPHTHGICMPVPHIEHGKPFLGWTRQQWAESKGRRIVPGLPRMAEGDAQRALVQAAHAINTSRVRIEQRNIGGHVGAWLAKRIPERFAHPDE